MSTHRACHFTWSAVLLAVLELLDEGLRFALVGPPVRDVSPEVALPAGQVVLVGHDDLVAQRPQVPQSDRLLGQTAAESTKI